MSNIKLVHSGGNSVSLTTPTNNPSSNVTFKLPGADGSANQVLKTDASGSLSFIEKGKVLQCKANYDASTVTVSNTTGNQNALYGLINLRVYGNLNEITITPKSATSTMIIQGLSGGTNSTTTYPSQGAYGVVAVLNNTTGFDNTDYQYYPLQGSLAGGLYLPNTGVQAHHTAGNTNAQTWTLKGYSYTEGSNTCTVRFIKHHLIIWEVEI